jgi:hypothetical protein
MSIVHSMAMLLFTALCSATDTSSNIHESLHYLLELDGHAESTSPPSNLPYTTSTSTSAEPLHLRNITKSQFKETFSTLVLPVVVIDDATRQFPMDGWTCASIATQFKDVHMRREYDNNVQIDPETNEPANTQRLGDAYTGSDTDWTQQRVSNGDAVDDSVLAPKFAPNYLPWKEFTLPDSTGVTPLARFQKYITVPYFLRDHKLDSSIIRESPEMWFAAVEGSGAKTHADGHCEATISLQLSGRKKWRIGPMHAIHEWDGLMARCYDGTVNISAWTPTHEVLLEAGQAVVFPPGMLHQTMGLPGECAASITFQWVGPLASAYLRTHMPRLLLSGGLNECFSYWEYLVMGTPMYVLREALQNADYSLYRPMFSEEGGDDEDDDDNDDDDDDDDDDDEQKKQRGWKIYSWREAQARLSEAALEVRTKLFDHGDLNHDGKLSLEEMTTSVQAWDPYEHPMKGISGAYKSVAIDIVSYLDVNNDQYIDVTEHEQAAMTFLTLHHIRGTLGSVRDNVFMHCSSATLAAFDMERGFSEASAWFDLWKDDTYEKRIVKFMRQKQQKKSVRSECQIALNDALTLIRLRNAAVSKDGVVEKNEL